MTDKAPDAYRTISEVAEDLDLPQHVLRFWETRFGQIKPLKRGGGRRYYRPDDVELLKGIRFLLYSEGYTIKGVQRILKEQGPKAVQTLVKSLSPEDFTTEEATPQQPEAQVAPRPMTFAPPALPPILQSAAEMPQFAPASVSPPEMLVRAAMPEPDLFEEALASQPPVFLPDPAPLPPIPAAPIAPKAPAGLPNVSFMRGGLSKPVVPDRVTLPRSVVPVQPPVEPPAQRFTPVFEARSEVNLPPVPSHTETPPLPPPVRFGLSPESRRALQSALFELTECRRVIERVSAARGR